MELTYTNDDGLYVTMNQIRPFFISKLDGTGDMTGIHNMFKAPEQDGEFYIGTTMDTRNITIEGNIIGYNDNDAYRLRRQLMRVFTPKTQGTFVYRNRKIRCIVDTFRLTVPTRQKLPTFFISLLCPFPYFTDLSVVRKELAVWVKAFHFILEIPTGIGTEFGIRQPSQIIELANNGDAPCGCEIIFHALGAVENPELLNVDTMEYIKINRMMVGGEKIHVYTHFSGKRIVSVQNNVTTNIFPDLDVSSTFLQIKQGISRMRYDAESGLDLLEVSIIFSQNYLGV